MLELKKRDPSRSRVSSSSSNSATSNPPALPDRRGSNSSAGSRSSVSSRTSSTSQSGPAVPPRRHAPDGPQETYDCIDADPGFDKKATLPRAPSTSSNEPAYLLTRQDQNEPPLPPRRPDIAGDVYEPPAPFNKGDPEGDGVYMDAEVHKDPDEAYQLMEQPTNQAETKGSSYTDVSSHGQRKSFSDSTASTQKIQPSGKLTMNSIIAPDYSGILKRKKTQSVVPNKWIEQTVVVKDNMIYIGDKGSSGEVSESFSLCNAVIESVKKQTHAFHIKPKVGKTTIFLAPTATEMHEWIRVLNKAKNIKSPVQSNTVEGSDMAEGIMDETYEVPEIEEPKFSQQRQGKFHPQDKKAEFRHIYRALYDCKGGCADEVSMKQGELILIDFKDHNDWWVGTVQSPSGQFNGKRGFVPRAFLAPEYERL